MQTNYGFSILDQSIMAGYCDERTLSSAILSEQLTESSCETEVYEMEREQRKKAKEELSVQPP